MTEQDFIKQSVAQQLGEVSGPIAQSKTAMIRALQGASGMAVAHVPGEDHLLTLDRNGKCKSISRSATWLSEKTRGALATILEQDPQFGFVVDMQDRRLRDVCDKGEAAYPVFCFNRHVGDRHRVLWPLPKYHDLDGDQFLAGVQPDSVDWADKKPQMIWRGATAGRSAGTGAGRGEGIRLKSAFKRFQEGKMSMDRLHDIISTAPRYRAVTHVADNPEYDFGFADGGGHVIAQTPLHAHLERPRLPHEEMQKYRYIAVLRGVDVGSSFYWVMNSGSVGFVQETPFETFASGLFRPWEHYIPFREDCSDLDKHFAWAEAHPQECRALIERAAAICGFLARGELRKKILHSVVAHLNRMQRV